jgi:hypothetical protein
LRFRNIVILAVILAVLVGVFYLVTRPEPTTPPKTIVYVWDIEMDDITHITISLPLEDLSVSFIKIPQGDKFPWFFDDGNGNYSSVNATAFGGSGPALLVSGPGANRDLGRATDEQLAEYGLTNPSMKVIVTFEKDGIESTIESDAGDKTIDGTNYYVRAPRSNQVALVDYTWYEVLKKLVKEPPYASKS